MTWLQYAFLRGVGFGARGQLTVSAVISVCIISTASVCICSTDGVGCGVRGVRVRVRVIREHCRGFDSSSVQSSCIPVAYFYRNFLGHKNPYEIDFTGNFRRC